MIGHSQSDIEVHEFLWEPKRVADGMMNKEQPTSQYPIMQGLKIVPSVTVKTNPREGRLNLQLGKAEEACFSSIDIDVVPLILVASPRIDRNAAVDSGW